MVVGGLDGHRVGSTGVGGRGGGPGQRCPRVDLRVLSKLPVRRRSFGQTYCVKVVFSSRFEVLRRGTWALTGTWFVSGPRDICELVN